VTQARSRNGVSIRLTDERWVHIVEEHSEMAGYYIDILEAIQEPDAIYEGKSGELLATKEKNQGKYLIVVYKELNKDDGFVITAFFTRRLSQIERRIRLWP
jgi:hypothetical protein